jgi:hypothetical protein
MCPKTFFCRNIVVYSATQDHFQYFGEQPVAKGMLFRRILESTPELEGKSVKLVPYNILLAVCRYKNKNQLANMLGLAYSGGADDEASTVGEDIDE